MPKIHCLDTIGQLLSNNMVRALFYFAVIASLISQLPMLLETGLDKYLKLSWVPLTILMLFLHPSGFLNKKLYFYYFFISIFGLYIFLLQASSTRTYITSGGDLYNIVISLLIFIDCFIFWKYYSSVQTYRNIISLMIIGCLILGLVVYFYYLQFADMASTTYAYDAKNSLGQILFVGGVMALVGLKLYNKKALKLFLTGSIIILLIIIMLLKSRATIICIFFVLLYYMMQKRSKKLRKYVVMGCLGMVVTIILSEDLYNLIVVNIIFANRDASSVSSLSSGRSELILKALRLIDDNWLLGVGDKYLDCMPIAILLQYGIIGFFIVIAFLWVLSRKVIRLPQNNVINISAFLIFCSFILNSLFEAYPPFGPGAKCFPLWMLLGFALSSKKRSIPTQIREGYPNISISIPYIT